MSLALLDPPQRELLRRKAGHVEELAQARPPRADWYGRLEDAVLDLSGALPAGAEDHDARKLFEFLIDLRRALDADPGGADATGEVELAIMRIADVARRLERRLLHNELDVPETAARFVLDSLADVGVSEIATLLGVSTKTLGAWRQGKPVRQNADRTILTAQLITYLRGSMTARGIAMWFRAPSRQLNGRTPIELLDAGPAGAREPLVSLARGARGQLAD